MWTASSINLPPLVYSHDTQPSLSTPISATFYFHKFLFMLSSTWSARKYVSVLTLRFPSHSCIHRATNPYVFFISFRYCLCHSTTWLPRAVVYCPFDSPATCLLARNFNLIYQHTHLLRFIHTIVYTLVLPGLSRTGECLLTLLTHTIPKLTYQTLPLLLIIYCR